MVIGVLIRDSQGEKGDHKKPVKHADHAINQGAKIVRHALKHEEVEVLAVAG